MARGTCVPRYLSTYLSGVPVYPLDVGTCVPGTSVHYPGIAHCPMMEQAGIRGYDFFIRLAYKAQFDVGCKYEKTFLRLPVQYHYHRLL